jgi:hypothetical protein
MCWVFPKFGLQPDHLTIMRTFHEKNTGAIKKKTSKSKPPAEPVGSQGFMESNNRIHQFTQEMQGLLHRKSEKNGHPSMIGNELPGQGHGKIGESQVQAKLELGSPGDTFEQEADRVAEAVVGGNHEISPVNSKNGSIVNRELRDPEDDSIQMKSGNPIEASPAFEQKLGNAKGSGNKLPSKVQMEMESGIGADFSEVNLHTDQEANSLSESINAQAFTSGKDVFFAQGKFNPETKDGKKLIAHELTHTVQQGGVRRKEVESTEMTKDHWELPDHMGMRDVTKRSSWADRYDYVIAIQPEHSLRGPVSFANIVLNYLGYVHAWFDPRGLKREYSFQFIDSATDGADFLCPAIIGVSPPHFISPSNATTVGLSFAMHSKSWKEKENIYQLQQKHKDRLQSGIAGNNTYLTKYGEERSLFADIDQEGTLPEDLSTLGIEYGPEKPPSKAVLEAAHTNLRNFSDWLDEIYRVVQDAKITAGLMNSIKELPQWNGEDFFWSSVVPSLMDGVMAFFQNIPVAAQLGAIIGKLAIGGWREYEKHRQDVEDVQKQNIQTELFLLYIDSITTGFELMKDQIEVLAIDAGKYGGLAQKLASKSMSFPDPMLQGSQARKIGHKIEASMLVELLKIRGTKSYVKWIDNYVIKSSDLTQQYRKGDLEWWNDSDVAKFQNQVGPFYKKTEHYKNTVKLFTNDLNRKKGSDLKWARFYMDDPVTDAFDWKIRPDKHDVLIYWPIIKLSGPEELISTVLRHIARMDDSDYMWNSFFKEAHNKL